MTLTIHTLNTLMRTIGGGKPSSHTQAAIPATSWHSAAKPHTRMICDAIVIGGAIAIFGLLTWLIPEFIAPISADGVPTSIATDPARLPYYALCSTLRMLVALLFSLIFSFVYGLAAARSRRLRLVLLPLLDVLQSVPILGFLSATITIWMVLFPGSMLGVEAASIFAIFTSQAWNMAFSFYQSLIEEPADLVEAAVSLRLTKWQRFWKLDVPHAMIPLLWNTMMSVGGGWFFLTASEMISVNNETYVLPGIGSFVGAAIQNEELHNVVYAIGAMIVVIILVDTLLFKPVTVWADKFRITTVTAGDVQPRRSLVLAIIRRSHLNEWLSVCARPIADLFDRCMRPLGVTGTAHSTSARRRRIGDLLFGATLAAALTWGVFIVVADIRADGGLAEVRNVMALGLLTFTRVLALTLVCSIIWVPVGVRIGMNAKLARIMQPLVQVCASFPANFTFPFVTLWFIAWHIDLDWGSVLLMALGTQWYILFNVIAGASAIPDDLCEACRNLALSRWQQWRTLILPSVFGAWCTGAITAAGGAWNASIVSEIVTYGSTTFTAHGLGAYIANATETGDGGHILIGVLVMSLFVVALNRLLWQPLQRFASKRFALA